MRPDTSDAGWISSAESSGSRPSHGVGECRDVRLAPLRNRGADPARVHPDRVGVALRGRQAVRNTRGRKLASRSLRKSGASMIPVTVTSTSSGRPGPPTSPVPNRDPRTGRARSSRTINRSPTDRPRFVGEPFDDRDLVRPDRLAAAARRAPGERRPCRCSPLRIDHAEEVEERVHAAPRRDDEREERARRRRDLRELLDRVERRRVELARGDADVGRRA